MRTSVSFRRRYQYSLETSLLKFNRLYVAHGVLPLHRYAPLSTLVSSIQASDPQGYSETTVLIHMN